MSLDSTTNEDHSNIDPKTTSNCSNEHFNDQTLKLSDQISTVGLPSSLNFESIVADQHDSGGDEHDGVCFGCGLPSDRQPYCDNCSSCSTSSSLDCATPTTKVPNGAAALLSDNKNSKVGPFALNGDGKRIIVHDCMVASGTDASKPSSVEWELIQQQQQQAQPKQRTTFEPCTSKGEQDNDYCSSTTTALNRFGEHSPPQRVEPQFQAQQQNLKPILKRKGLSAGNRVAFGASDHITSASVAATVTPVNHSVTIRASPKHLPPPILKKRDGSHDATKALRTDQPQGGEWGIVYWECLFY